MVQDRIAKLGEAQLKEQRMAADTASHQIADEEIRLNGVRKDLEDAELKNSEAKSLLLTEEYKRGPISRFQGKNETVRHMEELLFLKDLRERVLYQEGTCSETNRAALHAAMLSFSETSQFIDTCRATVREIMTQLALLQRIYQLNLMGMLAGSASLFYLAGISSVVEKKG